MVVTAVLLLLSLLNLSLLAQARPALRAAAAAGLLVLGVIAAFSIGLPIFGAGILAAIAAGRALAGPDRMKRVLTEIAAAIVAVAVLIAGFEISGHVPTDGFDERKRDRFVTGGYNWECDNGELHIQP